MTCPFPLSQFLDGFWYLCLLLYISYPFQCSQPRLYHHHWLYYSSILTWSITFTSSFTSTPTFLQTHWDLQPFALPSCQYSFFSHSHSHLFTCSLPFFLLPSHLYFIPRIFLFFPASSISLLLIHNWWPRFIFLRKNENHLKEMSISFTNLPTCVRLSACTLPSFCCETSLLC